LKWDRDGFALDAFGERSGSRGRSAGRLRGRGCGRFAALGEHRPYPETAL